MTSMGQPDWTDDGTQIKAVAADGLSGHTGAGAGDVDLDAVLTVVRRLPGVQAAYVLPAEDGEGTGTLRLQVIDGADEISTTQRVRTVLREAFGLDVAGALCMDAVDPRRSDDHPVPVSGRHQRQGRLRIGDISVQSDIIATRAHVELSYDGQTATGRIEVAGDQTPISGRELVNRAVAEATLSALMRLTGYRLRANVTGLELVEVGTEVTALVMVRFDGADAASLDAWGADPLTGPVPTATLGAETLTGAVVVRGDERTAIVRAVLDAANRWIGPLLG